MRGAIGRRAHEHGDTVRQWEEPAIRTVATGGCAASDPVEELLRTTRQTRCGALSSKQVRRHRFGAPVRGRDPRLEPTGARIQVRAKVRVVNKPGTARLEDPTGPAQICVEDVGFNVHQRVKAEDEIDALVRNHGQ